MATVSPLALPEPPRQPWHAAAACRGLDVGTFYPENGRRADTAKAWCAVCPVRAQCLDHALSSREKWGVWGGLTENERRALCHRRGAVA